MRSIELIGTKQFELNISKVCELGVYDDKGVLNKRENILIDKDPRGNWKFKPAEKGLFKFVLKETKDWINLTPAESDVNSTLKFLTPDMVKKKGANVSYVTLEEALSCLLATNRNSLNRGEIKLVATLEHGELVRSLLEEGWPENAVINKQFADKAYTEKLQAEEKAKKDALKNELKSEITKELLKDPELLKEILAKAGLSSESLETKVPNEPTEPTLSEEESKILSVFDAALELGIISKAGAYFKFGDKTLGQGRDKAIEALKADLALVGDIETELAKPADDNT
jgi:hypothetical protein